MGNSTAADRPAKPTRDFPLTPHKNGQWCKKVRGKLHYFGRWADDRRGQRAATLWAEQKDDLLAGRTPRGCRDGLSVRDLCNAFLTAKEQARDAGDITQRSFADYLATAKILVDSLGGERLVDDLAADDFQSLRASFAKKWGVHRLSGEVQRVRTLFKFGYDAGLVDKPIRFGPSFKRPAARIMRAHRQKSGSRMFEADELRKIIEAAPVPLQAMVLLGINAGFGNHDVGTLPLSALDLKNGWIDHPRPKTAVERRCPLWKETTRAIQEAIEARPKPKVAEHADLVFVTRYGQPWAKEVADSPVTKEFRKLLDELRLYRPGLSFYALRHTFETIAGATADQVAVNALMGHVDSSMAGIYRERIEYERLKAVTDHVRKWLFPNRKAK